MSEIEVEMLRILKQKQGFSLVELLTVVALIGIIAGIGTLSTRDVRARLSLKSATLELYSDLQLARLGAIRSGRIWRVCFTPGNLLFNSYSIGNAGGTDGDICTDADDPTVAADPAFYRKNVDLSNQSGLFFQENFSGASIIFNPRGTASSGNIKISLNNGITSGREITVNSLSGNISTTTF